MHHFTHLRAALKSLGLPLILFLLAGLGSAPAQTNPALNLTLAGGSPNIHVTGPVGTVCQVQSVSSLSQNASWQALTNLTVSYQSNMVIDVTADVTTPRFYRVQVLPAHTNYQPTWASVDQHLPAPEWFQDAKFGIYFCLQVASTPAYENEWYPRNMYNTTDAANPHHIATYGNPFGNWPFNNFITGAYDITGTNWVQFAPKLASQGGNLDPNFYAQLFVNAGAKYAGPMAEHHDGYSMWNSQANEWNSMLTGPHMDMALQFANAFRAHGLKFILTMHHAYHFNGFYQYVPAQTNASLQKLFAQLGTTAENQLWYDKLREIIDFYQPDLIYHDFDLNKVQTSQLLNFLSYYYNRALDWNKEVVVTYKDGLDANGEVYDYERGGPGGLLYPYWMTDDCVSSSSWCYTVGIGYYGTNAMLDALIDRVSKNGNMLLNIAPMADGTIPQGQVGILLGMGDWLGKFGESIYATRAWSTYGEGPTSMGGGSFVTPIAGTATDIRFTRNKATNVLYAIAMGWPGNGAQLKITTLNSANFNLNTLTNVSLIASSNNYLSLPYAQDSTGLNITMPASQPFTAISYAFKLSFSGQIPPLGQPATGTNVSKLNTTTMNGGAADWSTNPIPTYIGEFGGTPSSATLAALTLGGNLTLGGLQFDANLAGPVTIANTGGYTLMLGIYGINMLAANQNVTLNNAVALGGSQTWSVNAGLTLTVSGVISGTGFGITKTGLGTLDLNGAAANTYTGGTTINAGTLLEDFSNLGATANLINGGSALKLGGGVLQVKGNAGGGSSQSFASTTIVLGNNVISTGANNPTIALNGYSQTIGSTIQFVGPSNIGNGGGNVAATGTVTTTTAGNSIGTLKGLMMDNTARPGVPTVGKYDWASTDTTSGGAGSSPYTIIGGSEVSGFYTTLAGGAAANYDDNLDITGNSTGANNATLSYCDTLRFNTAAPIFFQPNPNGNKPFALAGILVTPNVGANNITIAGSFAGGSGYLEDNVNGTTAAGQITVWQNNTAGELLINSAVYFRGTGLGSYVQAGPGTVVLPGYAAIANNYNGPTYLNGGLTVIGSDNSIGSVTGAQPVYLNGGTLCASNTLSLDNGSGGNQRPVNLLGSGGGLAATAGVTMTVSGVISGVANTGPLTIGIPSSSVNGNTAGQLPGTGSGTANTTPVYATGTVFLNAADTYTGNTVVSSGTLAIGANGSINNTPNIIINSGTVLDTTSAASFILGSGQVLTGGRTSSPATDINGNLTSSGTINIAGTGTVGTLTQNGNLTFNGGMAVFDLSSSASGANDQYVLSGNGNSFTITGATSIGINCGATLDTADYVLFNLTGPAPNIFGGFNLNPVWLGTIPANAAHYSILTVGNMVVLHYTP